MLRTYTLWEKAWVGPEDERTGSASVREAYRPQSKHIAYKGQRTSAPKYSYKKKLDRSSEEQA